MKTINYITNLKFDLSLRILLLSAFLFLVQSNLSAAELKLLKQEQNSQGEWVAEYQISTNYTIEFTMDKHPEVQFPKELETAVRYFENIEGVKYLKIDHEKKIFKVYSDSMLNLSESVNR